MLEGFGERDEQWVHPNPIVNVDVGKTVADHVMEETEVEDAPLLPVRFGVATKEILQILAQINHYFCISRNST